MAFSRSFLNDSLAVLVFFQIFGFYDAGGMNAKSLSEAIEGKTPLHVVTLTRTTRNKEGYILPDKCLPISAAEAVTILAIANAFCGNQSPIDETYKTIDTAHSFDNKQFVTIKEQFNSKNKQEVLAEILEQELKSIGGLEESLISQIVSSRDNAVFKATLLKQDDNSKLEMKFDNINPSDIRRSKVSGVSGDKFVHKQEGKIKGTIEFVIEIGGYQWIIPNYNTVSKIKEALKLRTENQDEQLKKKYFSRNPFLLGYLGVQNHQKVAYYKELYKNAVKVLDKHRLPKTELCLFVANELFFGKDFILPNYYPSLLPQFSLQALTCINFLLEENGIIPDVRPFDEKLDQSCVESTVKWPPAVGSKYFRSVSFYKVGSKIVQEYSKSSYFQECDFALENGYTYLFGQCLDIPHEEDFTKLISTQICFDLQTKRRSNQTGYIPIHVFQSNTHDLSEVLAIESPPPSPSRADIPGQPKLIIHADPKNQELFVRHEEECFSWMENSKKKAFELHTSGGKTHYTTSPPQESFTFSIDKGDHVDSYTITHWVLK